MPLSEGTGKMKWTLGVIGLVVGALVAGLLTKSCSDKSIEELQAHSKVTVAEATAFGDSMVRVADSLRRQQVRVVTVVKQDTTAARVARQALASAKNARDSIALYQIENANLESAKLGLFQALALANAESDSLRRRGDSLQTVVSDLGRRIERLKPRPKWLRVSIEVVKIGGAAYAGYEAGRASMRKGS